MAQNSRIGDCLTARFCISIWRTRTEILLITLLGLLLAASYKHFSENVYPISGSIQLDPASTPSNPRVAGGSAEVSGSDLLRAAHSSDLLSAAALTINRHRFEVLGSSGDPIQALQRRLKVQFDPATNRLEVSIDSPFPHQAALIINTLLESLVKPIQASSRAKTGTPTQALKNLRINLANANVPPKGLPPAMAITLAACAGMLLGMAIAIYRGIFRERVGDACRIEEKFKHRAVVSFPLLSSQFSPAGRSLAAYIDPKSEAAAQCRVVAALLSGGEISRESGTFLITSPARGDGRSTLAVNLATMLLAASATVVLVDADIEAPVLHKIFEEPELSPGLCEALDNPSAATKFVRPTRAHHLHLLSCGRPGPDTSAKLQGAALEAVLARLREKYSYIIMDSGPLLGHPDAPALASRCHKALLVVEAGRTVLAAVDESRKVLNQHGLPELVVLVNAHHPGAYRNSFRNRRFAAASPPETGESYRDIHHYGWYREENSRGDQEILIQIANS